MSCRKAEGGCFLKEDAYHKNWGKPDQSNLSPTESPGRVSHQPLPTLTATHTGCRPNVQGNGGTQGKEARSVGLPGHPASCSPSPRGRLHGPPGAIPGHCPQSHTDARCQRCPQRAGGPGLHLCPLRPCRPWGPSCSHPTGCCHREVREGQMLGPRPTSKWESARVKARPNPTLPQGQPPRRTACTQSPALTE